jgi:hypothetical protein
MTTRTNDLISYADKSLEKESRSIVVAHIVESTVGGIRRVA